VGPGFSDGRGVTPAYIEKRCALPWSLVVTGVLSLTAGIVAALVTFVLSLTINKAILVLTLVAVGWVLLWVRYLRLSWSTGIWVDQAGIRIGDAHALPFATSQSQTVFTCSWAAVRKIAVSDRAGRHLLARSPDISATDRRGWSRASWLRLVPLPSSRGVLIIYVDRGAAGAPQAELLDNVTVYGYGKPAGMWFAPTRRPRALRTALAQVPGCPPVDDRPEPRVP
jgi:hypothetical protein